MKPAVFIPEPISACGLERLEAHCECLAPWLEGQAIDVEEALAAADALLVRLFKVDEGVLQRAPRLKVIAKHGVGLDNINLGQAAARDIPVLYTPEANANAVAEHAMALILALARQLGAAEAALRGGCFAARIEFTGVEVSGRVLGIVGLGRIGRRVAHKAGVGLGMQVLGHDPYVAAADYDGPALLVDSLDDLLGQVDFLTLHVPLTPETHHMLDAAQIEKLRPECRVINTSRGAVLDEVALAAALARGRIAGAAVDVFAQEPPLATHPLCAAPNALLTPHIAGMTDRASEQMALDAAQGIVDVLQGRTPKYPVEPDGV